MHNQNVCSTGYKVTDFQREIQTFTKDCHTEFLKGKCYFMIWLSRLPSNSDLQVYTTSGIRNQKTLIVIPYMV